MTINLTTDELKRRIEEHFESKGFKIDLYMTSVAQSGGLTQNVRFEGIFNQGRILEFSIYFNRLNESVITDFKGVCPIGELTEILNELKLVIDKL